MRQLKDGLGRQLHYLRLSITERCNFRCAYCLPEGCGFYGGEQPLSIAEIGRLVRGFAALGVWKVRLTGGEPTIRSDVVDVVRTVSAVPGIRRVGLTTNGYRLSALASSLRAAGLAALNVSIDSLDPARFRKITGVAGPERIVTGVEAALYAGIGPVKVNVVLLRGMDDRELDAFLDWTRRAPVVVRFIELMQTGDNAAFFREHHVSADEVRRKLEQRRWARLPKDESDGPASTFGHADHLGRVGLIAPYSPGFCDTCNRVRVSSTGDLQLCLFGDRSLPLRHLLASDEQHGALVRRIEAAVIEKPASHFLRDGASGATATLASIGG
jgi:cyclic pyranopterin phosphate synthase